MQTLIDISPLNMLHFIAFKIHELFHSKSVKMYRNAPKIFLSLKFCVNPFSSLVNPVEGELKLE